jgi:hypothetical protein
MLTLVDWAAGVVFEPPPQSSALEKLILAEVVKKLLAFCGA